MIPVPGGVSVGVFLALLVGEMGGRRFFNVSPTYATFLLGYGVLDVVIQEIGDTAVSGRERFDSGPFDDFLRVGIRAVGEAKGKPPEIDVASVSKRNPNGGVYPTFEDSTSSIVLGETGTGKSTLVKSRVRRWDLDGAVIAHGLSEGVGENELAEFFESQGQDVVRVSSRGSGVRWDPFTDFEESMRGMESLATGMFGSRNTRKTGWSEPAQSLLVCALAVTSAKYGDFARLPHVLERGPEFVLEQMEKVPGGELAARPVRELSEPDRATVYTALLNEIRPLLQSEIFDSELPTISLTDYLESPGERVIILDNIREDRYARGFWRLFIQSAIDLTFRVEADQYFLLDEVDKLPAIDNLGDLVSAGRSAGVRGVLVAQDVHQLKAVYGETAYSIWANCPNRVCFRPGDTDTAELALASIGDRELRSRTVSDSRENGGGRQVTRGVEAKPPLVTGDLMELEVGEVLIQSPFGWWLTRLKHQ